MNVKLWQLHSFTTAAVNFTLFKAFQKPSETSQELIDCLQKVQKQKHAVEDKHSQKQLQKDSPFASVFAAAS